MNEFEQSICTYWANEFPDVWSFLWSPEEAQSIPLSHKDQIHFLNKEGTAFLNEYLNSSKMIKSYFDAPFKDYFKRTDNFVVTDDCDKEIKKWLYSKGIPFSKYVFVDADRSGQAVMLIWKMVIKYWEGLFFSEDLVIFDASLEWGLSYFHHDVLTFGRDVIFNREEEGIKTMELNKLLKSMADRNKTIL